MENNKTRKHEIIIDNEDAVADLGQSYITYDNYIIGYIVNFGSGQPYHLYVITDMIKLPYFTDTYDQFTFFKGLTRSPLGLISTTSVAISLINEYYSNIDLDAIIKGLEIYGE